MKLTIATAATSLLMTGAVFAESHASGDPEAGEKVFNKCKSCHMVQAPDGETIVRGGRTGPNLYGIAGMQAGTVEGFRYGDDLVAAGEAGLEWTEENFVAYVQDPKKFLAEYLDDNSARSKMTFRLRDGMEDVYAFLASHGAEEEESTDGDS